MVNKYYEAIFTKSAVCHKYTKWQSLGKENHNRPYVVSNFIWGNMQSKRETKRRNIKAQERKRGSLRYGRSEWQARCLPSQQQTWGAQPNSTHCSDRTQVGFGEKQSSFYKSNRKLRQYIICHLSTPSMPGGSQLEIQQRHFSKVRGKKWKHNCRG